MMVVFRQEAKLHPNCASRFFDTRERWYGDRKTTATIGRERYFAIKFHCVKQTN